jgi:hypothetical protein
MFNMSHEENISEFKATYMKLNIPITPKLHAIFNHIANFCDSRQLGLGSW